MGRYSEAVTRLREALAASAPGNLVYNQQILLGLAQVIVHPVKCTGLRKPAGRWWR